MNLNQHKFVLCNAGEERVLNIYLSASEQSSPLSVQEYFAINECDEAERAKSEFIKSSNSTTEKSVFNDRR